MRCVPSMRISRTVPAAAPTPAWGGTGCVGDGGAGAWTGAGVCACAAGGKNAAAALATAVTTTKRRNAPPIEKPNIPPQPSDARQVIRPFTNSTIPM
jgi:hypothetical protein